MFFISQISILKSAEWIKLFALILGRISTQKTIYLINNILKGPFVSTVPMEQHVAEAAISSLMNATISSLLPGSSTFGQELELEEPPMGSTCEIGAIPMPSAEWLFTSVATFQQVYGQIHPYIAAVLCVVG